MPRLRAFRALRYSAAAVPDLAAVLCPPYDIIDASLRADLLARDERNAVRIELPAGGHGEAASDVAPYRAAARTVAEWRSSGVLVKDREPTITVHEMTWSTADGGTAAATGVFARLGLEPFGPRGGVRPHERTMTGPKEDRYQLLRATGINTSPVVLLAEAEPRATTALREVTTVAASVDTTTADGVRHRLWVLPVDDGEAGEEGGPEQRGAARRILAGLAVRPLTIGDGHHRYETALRYREERGLNRACESDPAWDYVLSLIYPIELAPSVLPTHRVMVDGPTGKALLEALGDLFAVERLASAEALLARMRDVPGMGQSTGTGRIGLRSGEVAALLTARPAAIGPLLDPSLSEASRGLDVNVLAVALERLLGVDAPALSAGGRLVYVKDAIEASDLVGRGQAASCFLLDPVPVTAVTRVAAAGEVMPQKSTYFHPKAPTGLLFGPLEW